MAVRAYVLYKGALACYSVARKDEEGYVAELISYGGRAENQPLALVMFEKQGRHCEGNADQELMDDLCYAVSSEFANK